MVGLISTDGPADRAKDSLGTGQSSNLRPMVLLWVLGTALLLPVKIFQLPFNIEIVDLWILLGLPILMLSFILRQHTIISSSYTAALLLILIASFVSIVANPTPEKSLIVVLKELYLFIWFVAMTAVLCSGSAKDLHRLMVVWSGTAVLHGLLMIAQFLSPDVWRMISELGGQPSSYDHYRCSGLFISEKAGDANKAAVFQLLGFVPLLLARPSTIAASVFAVVLLASILVTGSMGTTIALVTGLIVAIVAIAIFGKNSLPVTKYFMHLVIAISFVGGTLFFVLSQELVDQSHLERIVFGRAERSSGGRFVMWERGVDKFLSHKTLIWGIGPENFREVDWNAKQLHNDLLAFLVERGLLGGLGLILFGGVALSRAVYLLRECSRNRESARPEVVVFPAAIAVIIVISLTHQIFHTRELWLLLAVQEAVFYQITINKPAIIGG